jgi:DNA-directed RNA polymerase subunit RPC12/RpoP
VTGCAVPPCGAFLYLLMATPYDPPKGNLYRCGKCGREFTSPLGDSRLPCRYCDGVALRVKPKPKPF